MAGAAKIKNSARHDDEPLPRGGAVERVAGRGATDMPLVPRVAGIGWGSAGCVQRLHLFLDEEDEQGREDAI